MEEKKIRETDDLKAGVPNAPAAHEKEHLGSDPWFAEASHEPRPPESYSQQELDDLDAEIRREILGDHLDSVAEEMFHDLSSGVFSPEDMKKAFKVVVDLG